MKVVEIFNSIEGEGKRVGMPCTFIRLYSCNLSCSYCDSTYACKDGQYEVMSIPEILEQVRKYGCWAVTVTGGEPLIHPGITELLKELVLHKYWVNVETNGSQSLPFFNDRLFYTVDYKTFSSGMSEHMKTIVFHMMDTKDVLKFVVGSQEDMIQAMEFVESNHIIYPQIYMSPVFGKIEPVELVEFIKKHKLFHWSVQCQLHKIIWSPEQKGV